MAQMHELLAVEADLQGRYRKVVDETTKVFKDKPALFMGGVRKLEMFQDDGIQHPEEHKALDETVDGKLEYTADYVAEYFNAVAQKELTNQKAVADLVVDGEVLMKDAPATFLLSMEGKLKELRSLYENVPTLALGTEWVSAPDKGKGVFVQVHPEVTMKTKKEFKSQILVAPTDKHPAQIEKWEENVPVGRFVKTVWSGAVTPARKSELLGRVDKLIQAVKQARQRANKAEVVRSSVGKDLINFINK